MRGRVFELTSVCWPESRLSILPSVDLITDTLPESSATANEALAIEISFASSSLPTPEANGGLEVALTTTASDPRRSNSVTNSEQVANNDKSDSDGHDEVTEDPGLEIACPTRKHLTAESARTRRSQIRIVESSPLVASTLCEISAT